MSGGQRRPGSGQVRKLFLTPQIQPLLSFRPKIQRFLVLANQIRRRIQHLLHDDDFKKPNPHAQNDLKKPATKSHMNLFVEKPTSETLVNLIQVLFAPFATGV